MASSNGGRIRGSWLLSLTVANDMRTKLRRYLIGGIAMFLWALFISEGLAGGKVHSTRFFLVVSAIGFILPMAGMIAAQYAKSLFVATLIVRLTLWVPFIYPFYVNDWKGDDGSGMNWVLTLGLTCVISFGLACKNLIFLKNIN